MRTGINFLEYLDTDGVLSIMKYLDDPSDVIRAASVSQSWRHFVIANGVCKVLWLRKVPSFSYVTCVAEQNNGTTKLMEIVPKNPLNWDTLVKEHTIYSSLLHALENPVLTPMSCIKFVVGASSTENPTIPNTVILSPMDTYHWSNTHWSSKGHSDPDKPESILLKLNQQLCLVTEIDIQPFQVFWEPGSPAYSAKSMRLRIGHTKSSADMDLSAWFPPYVFTAEKYVWTYTSPEFAMTQDSCLQKIKLPKPVVCIGGFLLIELLGRTTRQETDGLYYIRIGYMRVLGHRLSPDFDVKMETSGNLVLNYCPKSFLQKHSSIGMDSA